MTKTEQKAMRLTTMTVEQAQELGKLWGPVKPLSIADVVAECIRRIHAQEAQAASVAARRGTKTADH